MLYFPSSFERQIDFVLLFKLPDARSLTRREEGVWLLDKSKRRRGERHEDMFCWIVEKEQHDDLCSGFR